MANEIYRIELDEKAFRLGESGSVNLSDWEAVFGSKLINMVDGLSGQSGSDDTDKPTSNSNSLTERYASAKPRLRRCLVKICHCLFHRADMI